VTRCKVFTTLFAYGIWYSVYDSVCFSKVIYASIFSLVQGYSEDGSSKLPTTQRRIP